MTNLGQLGEDRVLARVLAALGDAAAPSPCVRVPAGDDAAVLRHRGDTVITSDTMIEGSDFRFDWHTPRQLGWKLAATNLSDVAAMGAVPTSLTVALAAPADTPIETLEDLARGLADCCAELAPSARITGGDLTVASQCMLAVTAVGDLENRAPVLRGGARPGDTVAYAGTLGESGLGLAHLLRLGAAPVAREAVEALWRAEPAALAAHLTPSPPLAAGVTAANHGATAMMDVSDGLARDASRMAHASVVWIDFDRALLAAAAPGIPLEAVLYGGEDHGLLATFPAAAGEDPPPPFLPIGRVVAADVCGVGCDGATIPVTGWDPYRFGV